MKKIAIYARTEHPQNSEHDLYYRETVALHGLKALKILTEDNGDYKIQPFRSFNDRGRIAFTDSRTSLAFAYVNQKSGLNELLECIHKGFVDAIMVDHISAIFGGSKTISTEIRNLLIKRGVRLFSIFGEIVFQDEFDE